MNREILSNFYSFESPWSSTVCKYNHLNSCQVFLGEGGCALNVWPLKRTSDLGTFCSEYSTYGPYAIYCK